MATFVKRTDGQSSFSRAPRVHTTTQRMVKAVKKHSGSKTGMGSNKHPWVNGWNYSKRDGITKVFCHPYKGTHATTSKTGKVSEVWIAEITVGKDEPYIRPVLYYPATKKVIVNCLGWVLNPSAKNGGYCGTFTKRD